MDNTGKRKGRITKELVETCQRVSSLEHRITKTTADLIACAKELEAFSYSISRDLRSPLRSINSISESLLDNYGDKLDSRGKENLQRTRAAVLQVARYAEELLEQSRLMRSEMSRHQIDLSALAQTMAAELRKSQAVLDKYTWDSLLAGCISPQFEWPSALRLLEEHGVDLPYSIELSESGREAVLRVADPDLPSRGQSMRVIHVHDHGEPTNTRPAEERLYHYLELEKLIAAISTGFMNLSLEEIDNAINDALQLIGEFVGAERLSILRASRDGSTADNTHEWCSQDIRPQEQDYEPLNLQRLHWLREGLKQLQNIYIQSIDNLPPDAEEERRMMEKRNVKSLVIIPMLYHKSLVGLLRLESSRTCTWTEEHLMLLRSVGEVLAITLERKRAEEALRDTEEKCRAVFESLHDVYFRTNSKGRIAVVSPSVSCRTGYEPEELIGRAAASLYLDPGDYIAFVKRLAESNVVNDYETKLIAKNGGYMDVSVSARVVFGRSGKPTAVEGILHDITERKKSEEQLRQSLDKLGRSVEETIQALAATAEMRDAYTAGHQRRVSKLACAIAREMGLPDRDIEGIRLAGTIHDLGKVYVPAELLSKPSQLSEVEFNIIKMHPQIAYDILRQIEFPWPIACIVSQHHERMDGSGYPKGVGGQDILLEARILAVADCVEAMASHRPYRPALGIEKALDEISRNAGRFYDPSVVEACMKVFNHGSFQFEAGNA